MAFDFLGTFNKAQFDRFMAFARANLYLVDARIRHLSMEQVRVGTVVFRHDPTSGDVIGYVASDPDSYIGKLLAAYEVLGGNPFLDLDLRLINDPIFRRRGSEADGLSQYMSNGEVIGAPGLADAPSADAFREARQWLDPLLEYRFERLERKIRRAMDYYDQLQAEIDVLTAIKQGDTVPGSLEYQAKVITDMINDPLYRAIHSGTDPRGAGNYAPFSSYDADADGTTGIPAGSVQRQDSGLVQKGAFK
jgi:hypothetical protein